MAGGKTQLGLARFADQLGYDRSIFDSFKCFLADSLKFHFDYPQHGLHFSQVQGPFSCFWNFKGLKRCYDREQAGILFHGKKRDHFLFFGPGWSFSVALGDHFLFLGPGWSFSVALGDPFLFFGPGWSFSVALGDHFLFFGPGWSFSVALGDHFLFFGPGCWKWSMMFFCVQIAIN